MSQRYNGLSIWVNQTGLYIKKSDEELYWAIGSIFPDLTCLDLDWGGWYLPECEEYTLLVVQPILEWSEE